VVADVEESMNPWKLLLDNAPGPPVIPLRGGEHCITVEYDGGNVGVIHLGTGTQFASEYAEIGNPSGPAASVRQNQHTILPSPKRFADLMGGKNIVNQFY
jgi:hypothetical protein